MSKIIVMMVGLCVVIASLIILIVYDNPDEAWISSDEECQTKGGKVNDFRYPMRCNFGMECNQKLFHTCDLRRLPEASPDEAWISSKEQCKELEGDINQKKIFPYCDFGNNGCDPKLYSYCSFWPEEFDKECIRVGGTPESKRYQEPCEGEICLDRAIYYRYCHFPVYPGQGFSSTK